MSSYNGISCGSTQPASRVSFSNRPRDGEQNPHPTAQNPLQMWNYSIAGYTQQVVDKNKLLSIRIALFFFFTTAIYLLKSDALPTESVPCMKDVFMDYLQDMNNLVHEDEHLRKFLQITASISMDTVFLSLFIYWVLRGNSSRMFFAVASFYAVRLLVQQVVMMGFPQGYLWESPGFPSLVVPYGRTSDFYFSGHCGFLMICACEWWELGHKFVACIVHVVNLYMAYVMVVFQIHYTIDIFTGVIVGHYIFIYISKIAPYIDALLKKMYMCFTSAKTEPVKFANNAGLQNRIM